MNALMALSAIDGRYAKTAAKLAPYLSEFGLIKARLDMEIEYLLYTVDQSDIDAFEKILESVQKLKKNFTIEDAQNIKDIETKGWGGIPKTNHDVAALIAWLRLKLKEIGHEELVEKVHFGLTSEDCNNIAYALMLYDAISEVLLPSMEALIVKLKDLTVTYAELPMLTRTHGQAATPTTLGKEFAVFKHRLNRQARMLKNYRILVKLNGASGNYAAHVAAYPDKDWIQFTEDFVDWLSNTLTGPTLEANLVTTQIEPHDTYAELFSIVMRFNTVLVDCCQDIWRYISDGWLVQTPVAGEVGSSAMPHKVNPIDFENAEGNLLFANSMMEFFARKLPISRLQRDLSDSTVERNFGLALGHSLHAYDSVLRGLGKISPNEKKLNNALVENYEVVSEAIQTILRRDGHTGSYNLLKDMTRGKSLSKTDVYNFVRTLDASDKTKADILAVESWTYIGLASKLAKL